MSFAPLFSHPLSPATSFSTVFLGPDGGMLWPLYSTELHKPVGKQVQLYTSFEGYIFKHVKYSKLAPLFGATTGSDLGSGQELNVQLY